ncbi:hypothetical protein N1851_000281 [Merluccius polli]|uniref:HMG domain-containing protein n=1 Tax=Merluccius polli TaxID=89951 RepID=A0AA47P9T9_MERPO|nr:hypothetical protein N1851_000281 [Merluccius polli]
MLQPNVEWIVCFLFLERRETPSGGIFFPVFTKETDNWCQFGRTRVTFDAVAGQWNCQCRGTRESHRCIHRTLLATSDIHIHDIDDLESHIVESSIASEPHNVNSQRICAMTECLLRQKHIPCLQELPVELRTQEKQPPPCFVPFENTCPYCPGPTPPALNVAKVVTTQAMVYGMNYVKKGVSVAVKDCPTCGNVLRFQEYHSGFHNFNNRALLTLPLCELLLSGLANKTTAGRMLDTISFFNDNRYHHQIVRRAFHHFMSLTHFQFDFSCYQCGQHPAVVVADANWKLAFDVPLEAFKRPDPDTISDKDLEVDIVKAWADLDRSLIAEGLISGTSVANPYSSTPGHSTLAPWMGENTRVGNILPKTEVKKALKRKPDDIKHPGKKINEDIILEIIESKKLYVVLIYCWFGSIADMMNRLEEMLNFKYIYPKLFLKLQKAGGEKYLGGGFSCIHGVVYYLNFLFWTESARDHTDGLLSFKNFPTCFISDVAGQVARHTNNHTKQLFFQPHDGRLCAPTSDNLKLAAKKELKVDMQWVKNLRSPFPSQENPDNDRLEARHPITGTCERYSLYDRFHQKKPKTSRREVAKPQHLPHPKNRSELICCRAVQS